MSNPDLHVATLIPLLGRSIDDSVVRASLGRDVTRLTRDEDTGWLPFEAAGVAIAFKEARRLSDDTREVPEKLIVHAIFLNGGYMDAFGIFAGELPEGIVFSEHESVVCARLGPPSSSGGGVYSRLSRRLLPRWAKYERPSYSLHLQFSEDMIVDLVTLMANGFK